MKKLWIVVLIAMIGLAGCGGTPAPEEKDSWAELGSQFVQQLADGEYEEAFAQFDDTMKEALPLADLEQTWLAVQAQVGDYVQEVDWARETDDPYEIAIITGEFANAYIDIRVVFNADEQVSGLFFQPSDYQP